MGCDDCSCDSQPVTYLKPVERVCVECGSEITFAHSFSSDDNGRYWHLWCCPGEAA